MKEIYSHNKLLHIVCRADEIQKEGRIDLVSDNEFIQCAALSMQKGKTFRPHKHFYKESVTDTVIAQESWVVISGKVKVFFYDLDDTVIEEVILGPGDISITLRGGHTYEILEDNTVVYEYKTGPYTGQENDKVFIDE